VPLTLIVFFVIMTGWNIKYAATPQPNLSDLSPEHTSPILQFSINSLIWWTLCFLQFSYRYAIHDRFIRNRLLQYVDLLSLSNISLIIMDETCHGYYIHGRSAHGVADTGLKRLNENLRREESDIVPGRGLDDEGQGFELILSQKFRDTFNKIYSLVIDTPRRKKRFASFMSTS
jgi:meckelin